MDQRRRLLSWWWDYLVVLSWLLVVLVVVGVPMLAGWIDLSAVWSRRLATDDAITLLTVVPFLAYLVSWRGDRRTPPWGSGGPAWR